MILHSCNPDPIAQVNHFRWDHAALPTYYEQTRIVLEPVLVELNSLIDELTTIPDSDVACRIDDLYNCVTHNLYVCSNSCIPKCKKNFFKFWWCQELDELKEKAILSCRTWKYAGRPRNSPIHAVDLSASRPGRHNLLTPLPTVDCCRCVTGGECGVCRSRDR